MLEVSYLINTEPKIIYIGGCMFSGKTEGLIFLLDRYSVAGIKYQAFYPRLDKRYRKGDKKVLVSHRLGNRINALPVDSVEDLIKYIEDDTKVIAIDESQFFSLDIVDLAKELRDGGRTSIFATLTRDYRDEPFKFKDSDTTTGALMEVADYVITMSAICQENVNGKICGKAATVTERKIKSNKLIVVGGKRAYTAKCRLHYKKLS